MTWKGRGGKGSLIRIMHSLGWSFRQGERGVNAVFNILTDALDHGNPVEIPGGTLQCYIVDRQARSQWKWLMNVQTRKRKYSRLTYKAGPRRRFLFRPHPNLKFDPLPAPPAPVVAPPAIPPAKPTPEHMRGFQLLPEWLRTSPGRYTSQNDEKTAGSFWDRRPPYRR